MEYLGVDDSEQEVTFREGVVAELRLRLHSLIHRVFAVVVVASAVKDAALHTRVFAAAIADGGRQNQVWMDTGGLQMERVYNLEDRLHGASSSLLRHCKVHGHQDSGHT